MMKINWEKILKRMTKLMICLSFVLSLSCFIYYMTYTPVNEDTEYITYLTANQNRLYMEQLEMKTYIQNQQHNNINININEYEREQLNKELDFLNEQYNNVTVRLNNASYGKVLGFHFTHPILTIILFPFWIIWYLFFCWPILLIGGIFGWIVWFIWYSFIIYYSIFFLMTSDRNISSSYAFDILAF